MPRTACPTGLSIVVAVVLGGTGVSAEASSQPLRADFVVAPDGDDASTGVLAKPFATLQRARDAVRALKRERRDKDIVVVLRGGYYRLDKTLVLGLADAAPAGHTVTYAAYPGERPVIGSGVPVTGWTRVEQDPSGLPAEAKGKLWTAPVPPCITICTALFDGETWLPRARGRGFLPTKKWPRGEQGRHKRDLPFPPGAIPRDASARGADIRVVPNYPWMVNLLPLADIDVVKNVATTSVPATYGLGRVSFGHFPDGTCWLENVVECIDRPGEWALDRSRGRFILWPRVDKPSKHIVAAKLSELIRVEGKIDYDGPTDEPVRGLVFRGLTFTHADHWRWRPDKTGWGLQHDWEMFDKPTAMLRFRGAEDCRVEQCTFANSAAAAIRCDLHAQRIGIARNHIHHVGGVGVLLAGYGPGTKDVNCHNAVVDNHIHHVGEVLWHSPGIFAWQSGHNQIAHNHVHHTAYTGIVVSGRISWSRKGVGECGKTVRWAEIDRATKNASRESGWGRGRPIAGWRQREPFMHGRHNAVEYNDIHHCMQILGDGNGIYISGTGGGNRVRFNWIHDVVSPSMNAAIRCDDDQHGTVMHGNIIADCCGEGFIIKGANTITNNVIHGLRSKTPDGLRCLHCRGHLVLPYGDCTGAVVERNIFYAVEKDATLLGENPNNKRGPALLRQCRADRNVYFNPADSQWGSRHLTAQRKYGIETHSIAADPRFVDPENGDFRLMKDSPALTLGFVPTDRKQIGLRPDPTGTDGGSSRPVRGIE